MEWQGILNLKRWTELSAVIAAPNEVFPGVYDAGSEAYLQAQPYDSEFRLGQIGAPFATLAYWAPNLAALERCTRLDPGIEVSGPWPPPPSCLLLGTAGKYGDLVHRMSSAERQLAERAVYSSGGKFVHKVVERGRFTYCFLGGGFSDEDRVYCIEVGLL